MVKKWANISLLLVAIIWGGAFVAQVQGTATLGPLAFNFIRNIIASLFLFGLLWIKPEFKKITTSVDLKDETLKAGLVTGVILAVSMFLQQEGIKYSSAGKAGFITSLYIVIVPFFGLFIGHRVAKNKRLAVLLATVGLFLLSVSTDFSIKRGDTFIFFAAIGFAGHILFIDYFRESVNAVLMSLIQFITAALISGIFFVFFEKFTWSGVWDSLPPLLYLGILSSGVGYTIQIAAQKYTDPTSTSLILSLESVFAVIAGGIVLGETLSIRETIGCVLIFTAVLLAQLQEK